MNGRLSSSTKALLEAAACARPIIAADMPGIREIVRHAETGLLVPPRDVACIAFLIKFTSTCCICVVSIGVTVNCRATRTVTVNPRFSSSGRSNSKVFSTTSFSDASFNCAGAGRIAWRNCVMI